jgi:hypothetical protein
MTVVKNVFNRIHVQRLLFAAALFGLSLSANANFIARTTHGNFEVVKTGKSSELRPPQTAMGNGNAVASTGTVTQGMGATAGGSTAASGVNLGGTATVPVNGSNVPVAVKTNVGSDVLIPAAITALGCARGGVVGAAVCIAAPLALPLAMNWIANAGMRINPVTKDLQKADPAAPQDGWWRVSGQIIGPYAPTRGAACGAATDQWNTFVKTIGYASGSLAYLGSGNICTSTTTTFSGSVQTGQQALSLFTCPPGPVCGNWLPASMDDIAPYLNKAPVDPGIVKELTDNGQNLGNPPLQVSGPSSVPGPSTTTITNNSPTVTTTTITNTTNNYNYEGNKITNTGQTQSSSQTTTTKNPDGTTTTTPPTTTGTTTTTTGDPAPPEEPKVQCDKYPNSLGCAELDTPDAEIPKDTKTVTFSAEDPLGTGRCPQDVTASFSAIGGQTLKIIDWTTFCGMALPLRGLVIALASIMAFFIIMPGGVRE